MVAKVTGAMAGVAGEVMRGVTWVLVEELREGSWGIGGHGLTSSDVRKIRANAA